MTREEAKQRGEMMISWGNGDEWEIKVRGVGWSRLNEDPNFRGDLENYRRKPKPEYRPWTRETFPDVPFTLGIANEVHKATSWNKTCVYYLVQNGNMDLSCWDDMLKYGKQLDGSPCGEVVS